MARADILTKFQSKSRSALEFNYDTKFAPPIGALITETDRGDLNYIAKSVKYSSKVDLKRQMITEIMQRRGFKFMAAGTNRLVYKFLEDQSFVAKVAFDRIGIKDNPAEMRNQLYIKPYCCKAFECTPCGTIGFMERVEPLTSREEFVSVADDIYDLINEKLIGKYVIEDIGTNYFMNFGLRVGWGPVIIDYPYIYKLDGDKLFCNNQDPITGEFCLGEIDYDEGFNELHCTKCGKLYKAKELAVLKENNEIIQEGRRTNMKVVVVGNDDQTLMAMDADAFIRKPKKIIIPSKIDIKPVVVTTSNVNKTSDEKHNDTDSKKDVLNEEKYSPADLVHDLAETIRNEATNHTTEEVINVNGRPPYVDKETTVGTADESEELDDKIEDHVEDSTLTDTLREKSEDVQEEADNEINGDMEDDNEDSDSEEESESDMIGRMVEQQNISNITGSKQQKRSARFSADFYTKK